VKSRCIAAVLAVFPGASAIPRQTSFASVPFCSDLSHFLNRGIRSWEAVFPVRQRDSESNIFSRCDILRLFATRPDAITTGAD
jgi:hypothetical protein